MSSPPDPTSTANGLVRQVAIAAGLTGAALASTLAFADVAHLAPFMFGHAAMPLIAWLAGGRFAAASTVVFAALINRYVLDPHPAWSLRAADVITTTLFCGIQFVIAGLFGALRRAHQRIATALAVRDEFLDILGHELRTPLAALSLQADLLAGDLAHGRTHRATERTTTLHGLIRRLGALISSALDARKVDAPAVELEPVELDLVPLIHELVAEHAPEAAQARCTVTVDAPASVLGIWDGPRLEQVLANLLQNACKFGAGAPVELRVRELDDRVCVAVVDHGIGIPPDDLTRIFRRFERGVPARHYGGLGLGLYVTRQLVEAMGGHVDVQSTPGHGSTFEVQLPRRPPAGRQRLAETGAFAR